MLQRSAQVGEFYRMSPPAVYDTKTRLPSSYMGKPRQHTVPLACAALEGASCSGLTRPPLPW